MRLLMVSHSGKREGRINRNISTICEWPREWQFDGTLDCSVLLCSDTWGIERRGLCINGQLMACDGGPPFKRLCRMKNGGQRNAYVRDWNVCKNGE